MSTLEFLYGSYAQSITITLSGLANNAARQSNVVQNSGSNFLELLVQLQVGAQQASSIGIVNVYGYGTVTGSQFTEGATGSESALTVNSPTNLRLIGTISVNSGGSYISNPMPLSNAFGEIIPSAWGIVVENKSGASLAGSEDAFFKFYQGIKTQIV